jgi:hypothetical protein
MTSIAAGWPDHASIMPTVCEPCPGKTNANFMMFYEGKKSVYQ